MSMTSSSHRECVLFVSNPMNWTPSQSGCSRAQLISFPAEADPSAPEILAGKFWHAFCLFSSWPVPFDVFVSDAFTSCKLLELVSNCPCQDQGKRRVEITNLGSLQISSGDKSHP